MAQYAPNVTTISGPQLPSNENPVNEAYQTALGRYQRAVQYQPVWQPGLIQYAPEIGYDRGWGQQYLETINPPPVLELAPRVGAPEPQYTLRSYKSLAPAAASPRAPYVTRKPIQMTAPGINQMLQES